jgi:EAL domain-containing protein (putative c-di-GMP-specific phosphodiesterase class I)
MAVNISARQFAQAGFTDSVFSTLSEYNIPPQMLKLEVTESIVIKDMESTIAKMQRLKQGGINFAMDDFGTGYSSLTYLKRLPVDVLKIDQSFIRDATHDPNDAQIIRAIVAMATSLKLETIAEGVEFQEQLDFLVQEGCHAYQGYLFSPPVNFDEFCKLLAKHR